MPLGSPVRTAQFASGHRFAQSLIWLDRGGRFRQPRTSGRFPGDGQLSPWWLQPRPLGAGEQHGMSFQSRLR